MNKAKDVSLESTSPRWTQLRKTHLHIHHNNIWDSLNFPNQLAAKEPSSAEACRLRGWAHHEIHDFHSARRDLIRAVELEPDDPDNHLFLGVFLIDVWKLRWGIAELNQVFSAPSPARPRTQICAYIGRQHAYKLLGRFDEALADINATIELDPRRCLFCVRGQLHLRLERFADAEKDFAILAEKHLTDLTTREDAENFGLCYCGPWGLLKKLRLC